MASTINQASERAERDAMLADLRKQRGEIAGRLAKKDEEIAAAEDRDFHKRLGGMRRSEMTTQQKIEVIRRLGSEKYLKLAW
jgi:hypothetical protein